MQQQAHAELGDPGFRIAKEARPYFISIAKHLTQRLLLLAMQVQQIEPEALQYVLLDLPGLLFFTTYTLLVLFWAEIYHQVST